MVYVWALEHQDPDGIEAWIAELYSPLYPGRSAAAVMARQGFTDEDEMALFGQATAVMQSD